MVRFSLNINTCCLHIAWEIQDQIWAKIFCIPKNILSRTPMPANICCKPYMIIKEKLFRRYFITPF